jgi:hypothetical protein
MEIRDLLPNEVLVAKRKLVGMTDTEIAERIGLNLSWYMDVELHSDDILDHVDFLFVLKAFRILELNPVATFKNYILDQEDFIDLPTNVNLNEFIQARRIALGISRESISSEIGFYEVAIDQMESELFGLLGYPFDVMQNTTQILKISLESYQINLITLV